MNRRTIGIMLTMGVAAVALAPLVRKWVSTANPDRAKGPEFFKVDESSGC